MSQDASIDADRYLRRIGLTAKPSVDLAGLAELQDAHLRTVPFENLDVFRGKRVRVDTAWSVNKIVNENRGGWCFELNGAFAALLSSLGFEVALLGAAVLLNGPNAVVDHLTLEVSLDEPYLVDVGFGDSFTRPLRLNQAGPQNGGAGTFGLMPSSQGTTVTRHDAEGFPEPLYRFKRTHRALDEFTAPSDTLQADTSNMWHAKRVVTRLLGDGADRVSLTGTTLSYTIGGKAQTKAVDEDVIESVLATEFGIT